ncbi:MAG: NADPH-dependent F420 reductase [Patescibacteria group bacterium]
MKIGIIGSGDVGITLAKAFCLESFDVSIGTRDTNQEKLKNLIKEYSSVDLDTPEHVAQRSDIIVIAVKGIHAEEVVSSLKEHLKGKTIIDTTNPIVVGDNGMPAEIENGIIKYFTDINESLMERLQRIVPEANFVKAFNSVGNGLMYQPTKLSQTPSMFICGNNNEAKTEVSSILNRFGWEVEDVGMVQSARPLESLCILWCVPGFLNNDWNHAFKVVR